MDRNLRTGRRDGRYAGDFSRNFVSNEIHLTTDEPAGTKRPDIRYGGDTSGDGLTVKWGGKFYGNGASATDHPGSIAGTLGAKTADDLQSIVGRFRGSQELVRQHGRGRPGDPLPSFLSLCRGGKTFLL